jgi:alkanesulfonate monooxygenase SsuD/methylene tetrahydromethanopterin reductase-like flavin-dependent oxidoreductase (luciferase family)
LFDSIIYAQGGAPVTVREAALIYPEGMGMPRLIGTAADIADQLEHFLDAGGKSCMRSGRMPSIAPRFGLISGTFTHIAE